MKEDGRVSVFFGKVECDMDVGVSRVDVIQVAADRRQQAEGHRIVVLLQTPLMLALWAVFGQIRFQVFPQLADAGGWQSVLLVTNAAQSSSFCTFELHGLSLDRFPEDSGITASGSMATFTIPGPGGYRVWRSKNESALASGYATLDCTAPTVAQVLYASKIAICRSIFDGAG